MSEWDRRQLCPDGACVGLIGPDGRCKVCGRVAPAWGDERNRGLAEPEDDDDDDADDDADDDEPIDEIAPEAPAALGEAAEWQKRALCADGSCIGVIGSDGTCKVCGRAATPEATARERAASEESEQLEAAATEMAAVATDDEVENRALCPDGACIGVIGPDGTCKVCGKEAAA
jgi:hypothetical protein